MRPKWEKKNFWVRKVGTLEGYLPPPSEPVLEFLVDGFCDSDLDLFLYKSDYLFEA